MSIQINKNINLFFNSKCSKLFINFFIIVNIAFMTFSCVYYRTALEEEYRKQADEAYNRAQFETALEYYQKTRKITLNNNARYRVAEILLRLGKYDESRIEIDRLLRRDKKNTLVLELDAYWYFSTGQVDTAIEKYTELLNQMPYNNRILNNLGIIYQENQEYEKSLEYFNRILQAHEDFSLSSLDAYIDVIQKLDSELDDTKKIHLAEIVAHFLTTFKEGTTSFDKINQVAKFIERVEIEFAYPVYKIITEQELPEFSNEGEVDAETKEKFEIVAQANFAIAEMLLSKAYVPIDVEPLEVALLHLQQALDSGFGNTIEEIGKLNNLRENYLDTKVMKSRVNKIYFNAGIISKTEFERLEAEIGDIIEVELPIIDGEGSDVETSNEENSETESE